jgi:hypothetical protein
LLFVGATCCLQLKKYDETSKWCDTGLLISFCWRDQSIAHYYYISECYITQIDNFAVCETGEIFCSTVNKQNVC